MIWNEVLVTKNGGGNVLGNAIAIGVIRFEFLSSNWSSGELLRYIAFGVEYLRNNSEEVYMCRGKFSNGYDYFYESELTSWEAKDYWWGYYIFS